MIWLLWLFIGLVVFIIFYLIILTLIERMREKQPIWSGGFLSNCTTYCDDPYVCSGGFCLLPEGSTCSTAFDCASSLCSGTCITSTNGNVGDPCPCISPAICVGNKCLAGPGMSCSTNLDCANNYCDQGICAPGYPDGFLGCGSDNQCASGSCVSNVCSNGTAIGFPGAPCSCTISNVAKCGSGLSCDCSSNLCVVPNGGLFSACNATHTCVAGLECQDAVCNFPSNPVVPSDGVCQKNFTNAGGTCRSNTGGSCVTSSNCYSSSCSSTVMFRYSFSPGETSDASLPIKVDTLTPPPYPTTKLFNGNNVLVAVTSNGIYFYNGSWEFVLPSYADNHTLVDATYSTTSGYVGLFSDGYLYTASSSSWSYRSRISTGSSLLANGKYLECSTTDNLLLVTSNNLVYEASSLTGNFTGNLLYSSYGVSTPLNSIYSTAPVRYYNTGTVNPGGNLPARCPADFRYNDVVNCPSSANYAFLGTSGSLFFQGSYSGISQPHNNSLIGIDFALQDNIVAIIFPTGIYIGKDNVGSTAPSYFAPESRIAIVNREVYVLGKQCV